MQYNECIIASILINNRVGVKEVNDLETLKSGIF